MNTFASTMAPTVADFALVDREQYFWSGLWRGLPSIPTCQWPILCLGGLVIQAFFYFHTIRRTVSEISVSTCFRSRARPRVQPTAVSACSHRRKPVVAGSRRRAPRKKSVVARRPVGDPAWRGAGPFSCATGLACSGRGRSWGGCARSSGCPQHSSSVASAWPLMRTTKHHVMLCID